MKEILDRRLSQYPNSHIYLYYQARYLIMLNEIDAASTVLERTMELQVAGWPQLIDACAWELLMIGMYRLDWGRCLELARLESHKNSWSLCFSCFLQAVFLAASQHAVDPSPEVREKIFKILADVPLHVKRIAGRRLPIEKYAVKRAQEALDGGELLFYPEYELLLIWDGFARMTAERRERVLDELATSEKEGLRPYQLALVLLVRAAIYRSQGRYLDTFSLLERALKIRLAKDSYVIPTAHVEWAQAALLMRDIPTARAHYGLSTAYSDRYMLHRSLQLRHAKIKSELNRFDN
jgi:tetratricopeptide (TPR) repeat protein